MVQLQVSFKLIQGIHVGHIQAQQQAHFPCQPRTSATVMRTIISYSPWTTFVAFCLPSYYCTILYCRVPKLAACRSGTSIILSFSIHAISWHAMTTNTLISSLVSGKRRHFGARSGSDGMHRHCRCVVGFVNSARVSDSLPARFTICWCATCQHCLPSVASDTALSCAHVCKAADSRCPMWCSLIFEPERVGYRNGTG